MRPAAFIGALLLLPLAAQAASAQAISQVYLQRSTAFPTHAAPSDASTAAHAADSGAALPLPGYGGWVSVTKWVTLAGAVGFGILGAVMHEQANQDFRRLLATCERNPQPCREFNEDGSYIDPILENMYQTVSRKDNLARFSLIAAEVSFAASVVLFIVDFQRGEGPSDIPYDPPDEEKSSLQLAVTPGEFAVRYYIQ